MHFKLGHFKQIKSRILFQENQMTKLLTRNVFPCNMNLSVCDKKRLAMYTNVNNLWAK